MKPYVESGRRAQQRLENRESINDNARERYFMDRLRGFKQVINTLSVTGIVMIPLVGISTHSAFLAAVVALMYAGIIGLLELGERRVKRELHQFRQSQHAQGTFLGGLENDRVTRRKRRRYFPHRHHQRVIPGGDGRHDAGGLVTD